jgi:hypothetical protein
MVKHDDSGPGPTETIPVARTQDVDPAANRISSICRTSKFRLRIELFAALLNGTLAFPLAPFVSLGEERSR